MAAPQETKQPSKNNGRLLDEFSHPSYEAWRQLAEQQLKGAPFEKRLVTKTYEGIDLQPLYQKETLQDVTHLGTLPGYSPYVRGSAPLSAAWQICQEFGYSTAEEFNEAAQRDLEQGQTAVSLRLDKAAQQGQDPDQAEAGEVGQGGVSIASIDDLNTALAGIDLTQVPVFIQAPVRARPILALLIASAKRRDLAVDNLQGGLETDPLAVLAQEGEFPGSMTEAYDDLAELLTWIKANAPQLYVATIHDQPYNASGANAVQELAFTIATAVEYIREMQERGLEIDDIAPRLRFSLSLGSNYFMGVAKLRAARLLWAKVVKAFGGNEESQKMTIHARTTTWNKTVRDAHVNILRTTTESFAGAVGGCESMHTGYFDETIRQPNVFSRRVARNIQLVLQQETHLTKVTDPAGGSWYVENLTDAVGRKAWALFQEVEKQGGMLKALQAGFPQSQVSETAAQREASIATRKDVFVGTNKYADLMERKLEPNQPDYAAIQATRAKAVTDYRAKSNAASAQKKLGSDASLDAMIEAASAGATLGELTQSLSQDGADKVTVEPLHIHRGTEKFEALRAFAEAYEEKTGSRPKVFLANMGPIPQHKPRADFSTDFFQVGGFAVIGNNGFDTPELAAEAALASGAPVVVICSTDATYPEFVPPLTKAIKAAKPETKVIVAGYPKDQIDAFRAAGVDEFIHIKADAYGILAKLQEDLNE